MPYLEAGGEMPMRRMTPSRRYRITWFPSRGKPHLVVDNRLGSAISLADQARQAMGVRSR
jgi:hypothetical protein